MSHTWLKSSCCIKNDIWQATDLGMHIVDPVWRKVIVKVCLGAVQDHGSYLRFLSGTWHDGAMSPKTGPEV